MKRTISAEVGKGSVNHNSRKFTAENVDPTRTHLNINYCNEDIQDVYHEMFGDALQRYNEKQTRSDRRIDDYYEKIRSGKQEKPFHEVVLQIGNKDDMSAIGEYANLAKNILDEYFRDFQSRNPQLRVFSAHLHMDEATPHIHIDFVPFTTGSKRGLDTRVSLKKALEAQGFKGGTRSETEWNQWVQSEKEQLAKVMERYDIEWEHKGTHEQHLSVLDFKKKARMEEVSKLDSQISEKTEAAAALDRQMEEKQAELSAIEAAISSAEQKQVKLSEIDAVQPKKSTITGKVSLTESEFETLSTAAKKYVTYRRRDISLQKKVDELTEQVEKKASLIEKLRGVITELKNTIAELTHQLADRESIKEKLERSRLLADNDNLRTENKRLRDVLAAHEIPFRRGVTERDDR